MECVRESQLVPVVVMIAPRMQFVEKQIISSDTYSLMGSYFHVVDQRFFLDELLRELFL